MVYFLNKSREKIFFENHILYYVYFTIIYHNIKHLEILRPMIRIKFFFVISEHNGIISRLPNKAKCTYYKD